MTTGGTAADHRTYVLRDSLVVFWMVFWLAVGILTGVQVWSLSQVSEAASASARAADTAGEALQQISEIPLVPEGPGQLGNEVRAAATEIRQSSVQIGEDVRRLSVLLGVSVALVPTAPVVAMYLPGRLRWRREVRQLRSQLERRGRTAALDAYLAHQAVSDLGPEELAAVTDDPAGDLLAGRHEQLAALQLRRLGLSAPRSRGPAEA